MKVDELKERLKRGMRDLQNFLRTNEGKNAMMILEGKYSGTSLVPNDPYTTHYKLGQKEVVEYLIDLRDGDNI